METTMQPMSIRTCPKCGSPRWSRVLRACLHCWWKQGDWQEGHLRPVTDRVEWSTEVPK